MMSEAKLKLLIIKGVWRYSFLNLGQYFKVDVDPPAIFGSTNNSRPVVLRIVAIDSD